MAPACRLSVAWALVAAAWATRAGASGLLGEGHFPIVYAVYGPQGVPLARAIVPRGEACPKLAAASGADAATRESLEDAEPHVRAEGQSAMPFAFPVRVCEVQLPRELARGAATLGGKPLPPLTGSPGKFLLIGDTGLRVKPKNLGTCARFGKEKLYGIKQCEETVPFDPKLVKGSYQALAKWPLESIADTAAGHAPDVVVHVGDYLYRQGPCAEGEGCDAINNATNVSMPGGWGDNWKGWYTDFFEPSAALLAAAPWIAVRGNHEACDRGGHGFFLFLDPRPLPTNWTGAFCHERTDAYRVPFAGEQFLVLDDNFIKDFKNDKKCPAGAGAAQGRTVLPASRHDDPEQAGQRDAIGEEVRYLAEQFRHMEELAEGHTTNFYLGHHPLLGVACHGGEYIAVDWTLQEALKLAPGVLGAVSAAINGHVHWLQGLVFDDPALPVNLIVGNGGTELDPARFEREDAANGLEVVEGATVRKSHTAGGVFGFSTMARLADGSYDVRAIQAGNDGGEPSEMWQVTVPGGRERRLRAGEGPAGAATFV